jgi:hypothetical protein
MQISHAIIFLIGIFLQFFTITFLYNTGAWLSYDGEIHSRNSFLVLYCINPMFFRFVFSVGLPSLLFIAIFNESNAVWMFIFLDTACFFCTLSFELPISVYCIRAFGMFTFVIVARYVPMSGIIIGNISHYVRGLHRTRPVAVLEPQNNDIQEELEFLREKFRVLEVKKSEKAEKKKKKKENRRGNSAGKLMADKKNSRQTTKMYVARDK